MEQVKKEITALGKLPEGDYLVPPINSPLYRNCSENIALELAGGATVTGTAFKYGIDRKTIQTWSKHPHFLALVQSKKDFLRDELLNRIKDFGEKNWLPNAWLLERNKAFEGEFAQPKAQSQAGGNVQVNVVIGGAPGNQEGVTVEVGQIDCDIEK